jgi:hypothetical protein
MERLASANFGTGVPVLESCRDGACRELDVTLNDNHLGIIRRVDGKGKITEAKSQSFANAIGAAIERQYF